MYLYTYLWEKSLNLTYSLVSMVLDLAKKVQAVQKQFQMIKFITLNNSY